MRCGVSECPHKGLNSTSNLPENSLIGEQHDALSDARRSDRRLIELVESWAGLSEDVKDRIAELVVAAREASASSESLCEQNG